MGWWPLSTNNSNLLLLRNSISEDFKCVNWHSIRHTVMYNSPRHQVLKAITNGDTETLESCLKNGWPVNALVDKRGRYTAVSLACKLDRLEMVHLLDLYGADLSGGKGRFKFTPLMTATEKWNVRIVDYLLERGVDPFQRDVFGFTAAEKSKIMNLNTIHSMISSHERKMLGFEKKEFLQSAITNKEVLEKLENNKFLSQKLDGLEGE